MKVKIFYFIGASIIILALFLIGITVHRSIFFLNNYFPGFFIYYNKVINTYDAPENWSAREKKIPFDAVLTKIDDKYINSVNDFWEVVEKNKNRQKEFVIEYTSNGERNISFIISQKFTFEDYIKFILSWQFSGLLFVLLGIIVLLGNMSKKGILWFLTSTIMGFNFITTPMSSFFSNVISIVLTERLSFAIFPALVIILFLEFPLRKFNKTIRSLIVPLLISISISFLFISVLALFVEEAATIQASYYIYPGLAGIFSAFASVYDYVRTLKKKKFDLVSNYVFSVTVGISTFILVPSIIATLIFFLDLPSYYIPSIMIGYPIITSNFIMRKSFYFLRLTAKEVGLIFVISLFLSVAFWFLFISLSIIPIMVRFIFLVSVVVISSLTIYAVLRDKFISGKKTTYEISFSEIESIVNSLKDLNDAVSFYSFINNKFSNIIKVSFAKFLPHNVLSKTTKKKLYYSPKNFISVNEDKKLGLTDRELKEKFSSANYIMILKTKGKFFGCILLGKRVSEKVFSDEEIQNMEILTKVISHYFSIIVLSLTNQLQVSELGNFYIPYFDKILTDITIREKKLVRGAVSVNGYLSKRYDGYRPLFYKIKDFDGNIYFCLLWISSKNVLSYIIMSILKGVVDHYFNKDIRGININRLPREIRNVMASLVRGIDIDLNITTGFIKKESMIMDVVNDGKTSIFLQTEKGGVVPMPKQKRLFEFNKIKSGDTFFLISSENTLLQFEEMQNMDIRKFNFAKFVKDQRDVAIIEINFHDSLQK